MTKPTTETRSDEELVDSIMGLIIQNSVGLTLSDRQNDYGYANGVYLNNIKAELPQILSTIRQEVEERNITSSKSE